MGEVLREAKVDIELQCHLRGKSGRKCPFTEWKHKTEAVGF